MKTERRGSEARYNFLFGCFTLKRLVFVEMGMPPGPSPEPGAEDMFLVIVVVPVRGRRGVASGRQELLVMILSHWRKRLLLCSPYCSVALMMGVSRHKLGPNEQGHVFSACRRGERLSLLALSCLELSLSSPTDDANKWCLRGRSWHKRQDCLTFPQRR